MKSKDQKIFNFISHTVMIAVTIIAVLPFILVFVSSITEENTLVLNGYSFFPEKLRLYAYEYIIMNGDKIFRAYGVTLFVTLVGTSINVMISAMLAYGLSLPKLPGRRIFTFYVVFTLLFNGGLVPTYLMYTSVFNVKNTIFALIVPTLLMHTMNVLLMKTYYSSNIPGELLEAAEIDGCGEIKRFVKIVLPMALPALGALGIFSFFSAWNDYLWQLIMIADKELRTTPIGIALFSQGQITNTGYQLMAAMIATLPMLLIFLACQKFFIKGITIGGVKG